MLLKICWKTVCPHHWSSRCSTWPNFVLWYSNSGMYPCPSQRIWPLDNDIHNRMQRRRNLSIWQFTPSYHIRLEESDCSPAMYYKRCHPSLNTWTHKCTVFQMTYGISLLFLATTLANGEHPGAYQFDQPNMRKHWLFSSTNLYLPPVKRTRRADKYKVLSTILIYGSCHMPEQAGCTMFWCCTCKEWYHIGACVTACVTVAPEAFDSTTKWFCSKCT